MTLCERFGCLPSALAEEDAEIFRLVALVEYGTPEQQDPEYPG